MKSRSLVMVLCLSPFFARAAAFDCQGHFGSDVQPFEVRAIRVGGQLQGDWIKDAVATVQYEDYDKQVTVVAGRAKELNSDEKYQPSKYLNHDRYNLASLTDIESFGNFLPMNDCQMDFVVPKNARETPRFKAVVIMHCEQSGGSMTLQCVSR
jgi:hypothetical protein